jgi:hypothetical protein
MEVGEFITDHLFNACISALISAPILWICAKHAGIKEVTFWKSLLAEFLCSFIIGITMILGEALITFGFILGLIIWIPTRIWSIKFVFDTTWERALSTWIFIIGVKLLLLGLLLVFLAIL